MSWCVSRRLAAVAVSVALAVPAAVGAQSADSPKPGRFDFGKMWTFEYAPAAYFSETYGFDASPEWFERARPWEHPASV